MATAENPRANFENRTIWTADNLPVLRGLNDDCVDLVYADPPFKTERRYTAADSSNAAGASFRDTWRHRDEEPADREAMARTDPAAIAVIDASTAAHGGGMRAYLAMMAVRLIELRRVLKPTGTLYLHCDDNADGYLRILCDAVMGAKRFRNAIVWKRSTRTRSRGFGRTHDTVLAYSPGNGTWNEIRMAEPCEGSDRFYTESDTRGRYKRGDLTGAGVTGGESGRPWRDHDPSAGNRHWAPPRTGGYAGWIEANAIPGYRTIKGVHARLDALEAAGLIHRPKRGRGWPMLKRYREAEAGRLIDDVFDDIGRVSNLSREYVGYPTQKPLALVDRLIAASSNPGDTILEPFCGCGTACLSAEFLGRRWAGIDISPTATRITAARIRKNLGLFAETHRRTDIPERTDRRSFEKPATASETPTIQATDR